MPGETKRIAFTLPDPVNAVDTCKVHFYQDGEEIVHYDEEDTDNLFTVEGGTYKMICQLPREDTLKFENKIPAYVQIEWTVVENTTTLNRVAKKVRITVGEYLARDEEIEVVPQGGEEE